MKHLKTFFAFMLMAVLSIGQVWAATYEKATSIAAGDVVLLVYETGKYELSGISTTSTKYGTGATYTTAPTGTYELTVEAGSSNGTFAFKNGSNYLTWTSGNSLNKATSKSANTSWTVSFSDGNATITNAADNTRVIKWNNTSGQYRFACYTSGQQAVQLYKKSTGSGNNPTVSVSPTSWDFGDVSTTGSASKTFSVSGTYLTSGQNLSISVPSGYSVTPNSITVSSATLSATNVTVSKNTSTAGTYNGNMSISGGGQSSAKTVALSMTVVNPPHDYQYTHDFTAISGFSSWSNSYSEHVVNYDIYNGHTGNDDKVVFASANKQGSTITDRPVTKGEGPVSLVLLDPNKYISAVKFVCKQWNTNTQTLTLKYSTDGGTSYSTLSPSVTSSNFTIESLNLPAKTNAVQITFSSTNKQIGISSVSFDLVDKVSYNISKVETGCTLSVTNGTSAITSAEAGDEVHVSIASTTEGYEGASFSVKDADNNTVAVSNGKFTMPAKAVTITATATKKQYTVTLSATNGKIQVGGVNKNSISIAHGETAELTAVADDDYAFQNWTKEGNGISLGSTSDNPMTITVTGAGTVTANFYSTAKTDPALAWAVATVNAVKGQTAPSLPGLTNNYGVSVSYSSTNTSVAEINASTGVITINGVGSTTIKATHEDEGDEYAASEASFTLVVKGRITWHVIKEGVDATSYEDYVKDAVPTKPTPTSCDESISLVGWTTATYAKSNTAPSTLYTGNVPAVTDNADYYAVWANVSEDEWAEITSVADLTAGTYAICNSTYFMKSAMQLNQQSQSTGRLDNGSATPSINNGKLNVAPAVDCQWTLSINADSKYLIQNGEYYAAGTTAKNKADLIEDATDAHAQWIITRSNDNFVVENVGRASDSDTPANKYLRQNGTSGWACYSSSQGTDGAPRFFKLSAGTSSDYTTNCTGPLVVAAPTFSPDGSAAYYTSAQTVTISCTTTGAAIYYSLDGSEPATLYTTPITISETKTLKAKAVLSEVSSEITEATFTINLPLTTIQAVYDKAVEIGTTAKKAIIVFDNWVVSGIGSDNKSVYVTDGTKGFVIYGSNHGFAKGNILNGSVECDLCLFSGFAEVKDLKASNTALTVTNGGIVTPREAAIAELGGVNVGAPIVLSNLKYDGTNLVDDGENVIAPNNTLWEEESAYTLTTNRYYNVTGLYVHTTTTKKIAPRVASDIELLANEAPTMTWYVDNSKEETIGATYTVNADADFNPYFETNSLGSLAYSSTNTAVATISASTCALHIEGVGTTVIRCDVASNGEYLAGYKSFTLTVNPEGTASVIWDAKVWANISSGSKEMTTNSVDDNVDMTWDKGTSTTAPKYYVNGGDATRIYNGNTLTLTSKNSKIMTKVKFTFSSGALGENCSDVGLYNTTNAQWTGFANSVTFTSSATIYIKQIEIEYTNGTTTTLAIGDIEMMDNDAALTIAYACNKTNPVIVYSDYNTSVISIANGQITPMGVGTTTVKASIAADVPYSSASITFNVRVKDHQAIEDEVVILAKSGDTWYALMNEAGSASKSLNALEVEYSETHNVILDLTSEEQAAVTWKRTRTSTTATFVNGANYIFANSASTDLTLSETECIWTISENSYLQGSRTFIYTTAGYFKNYNAGNAGSDSYSDMPIVIVAAFGSSSDIPQTYTVTYNLNGGEGTTPTQDAVEANTVITLAGATGITAPEGMEFDGWLCDIDNETYAAGAEYTMTTANTTFTAQWKAASVEPEPATPDYTRNVTAGRYGTICLPNGGTIQGASIFEIAYFDISTRKIFFDEIVSGEMEPGMPYVVLASEGSTELKVYYSAEESAATEAGSHNGLYGHFDASKDEDAQDARLSLVENDYFLYNNQYYRVDADAVGRVMVGNYRAYIKLDEVSGYPVAPAPGRRRVAMNVNGEQVATDIENAAAINTPTKMLIDGRMYIIHGDKMYDVTGKLTK